MATSKTTTTTTTTADTDTTELAANGETAATSWFGEDAVVLTGVELTDKKRLVGVKFMITAVKRDRSTRGFPMMLAELVTENGDMHTISDASSRGVREQLERYLRSRNIELEGVWIDDLRIVAPEGLRASTYLTQDGNRKVESTTYYLTVANRRA